MMRLVLALLLYVFAAPAVALEPATTGVVLLHDIWRSDRHLDRLAKSLDAAGFLVDRPEMPWSGARMLDRGFAASLDEVAAAVRRLRERGAARIVLVGHGLGGNAALGYAATGAPLAGLVLLAPSHLPEGPVLAPLAVVEVERARRLLAAGSLGPAPFIAYDDAKKVRAVEVRPDDFLSYYDPAGPAAASRRAYPASLPVLWLAPSADPAGRGFAELVAPLLQRLERRDVVAGRRDAPDVGTAPALDWLRGLTPSG